MSHARAVGASSFVGRRSQRELVALAKISRSAMQGRRIDARGRSSRPTPFAFVHVAYRDKCMNLEQCGNRLLLSLPVQV